MIRVVLALSLAFSMLGAGGLLHLAEHLPHGEDADEPWECSQCKIAENLGGELGGHDNCFDISAPSGTPLSCNEAGAASRELRTPVCPRAPPTSA